MYVADAYRAALLRESHAVRGSATVITPPTVEPVSLEQAKLHLHVSGADEDSLIDSYIMAARTWIEARTKRALVTQTCEYAFDSFPCSDAPILLPRPPLRSVTSVTSYSTSDAPAVFASSNYLVDTASEPGRIALNNGASWPSDGLRAANAGVVQFEAGYGAPAAVPKSVVQALLLLVGHWYAVREAVNVGNIVSEVPYAVDALLAPYLLVSC